LPDNFQKIWNPENKKKKVKEEKKKVYKAYSSLRILKPA